ncbi:DMT family transporter [Mesorhizobium sp. SB112]|uniref:DMT family transporter n=1 Tax=Mesorhizobium sp. SB112 TaxID=3151853 RepID=UPI0032669845
MVGDTLRLSDRRDAIDAAAVAILIGITFSWGLNGVAAKLANTGFNPIFVTLARSALGGILVLAWCRYRKINVFTRDGTLVAGLIAGSLFGVEFILVYVALDYTSVARSTLMVNTMPFWVLIGAHFLLGERMSAMKFAGMAMAFVGVALVFSDRLSLPDPSAITGDIMSLVAGALWAATTLVIKKTRLAETSAEKLLLYQLAVASVMALPLLAVSGPIIREISAISISAILFQAVFIVAFTYILWFWLMRRYPATGLSSFAFLTPAFGVICGGVLLGETISARIVIALVLIAAGLMLVNRPAKRKTI